jgi:maltooligosyltrehalose trehalohydrolase
MTTCRVWRRSGSERKMLRINQFEIMAEDARASEQTISTKKGFSTADADVSAARYVVGANVVPEGVLYRVWAPEQESVTVVTERGATALQHVSNGFFTGIDRDGRPGDTYNYKIADGLVPDPASRYQPQGVDGPSQVIDPRDFDWQTQWVRPVLRGRVIYELHVGAFTPAGTFLGAIDRLDDLVELGVNTIELMPLGDFPGRWNWGYDGVMIFAPARCYGTPNDLRALIDAAHRRGLAVIIDVVYNHLGPCGNVLPRLSREYFHSEKSSIWGQGLNFDGPGSEPVRAFFLQNACAWFDEYHVDGLRLDAVHAIHDSSERHIVAEIAAQAEVRGAFVIAEDERNDARIISDPENKGWGAHGMWADDFHHSVRVALTGQREAYFANYTGRIDECVKILRNGWLYHGQFYPSWRRERGSIGAHLPPERFIFCISNHDQVGNRPLGDRLSDAVSLDAYRALSMLLCFVPYTPMLFMGQEWAARSPFPFFTDLPGDVGTNMAENRLKEFRHYNAVYDPATLARMPDPQASSTFDSAKLRWEERTDAARTGVLALYKEGLRIRAREEIFHSAPRREWEVRKCGQSALVLRWHDPKGDWLLIVSLAEIETKCSEAFVQSLRGGWNVVLWSNAPKYVGHSAAVERRVDFGSVITFSGPGAVLLRESNGISA